MSEAAEQGAPRRRIRRVGPAPARAVSDAELTLAETLDRVLSKGVVAHAELVLCVADIPLVYVGLQALVSSVETALREAESPHDAPFGSGPRPR